MARICIQWPRLGPLHLNRINAAYGVMGASGHEVVALETASDSSTYQWRLERGEQPFRRVTVFEDRLYNEIVPRAMHKGVTRALDDLQPDAVLIHSYSTPDARAALLWCRRNRRIAVCMAESRHDDARRSTLREGIKRLLVSQFDSALASGTSSTEYITSLGLDRRRVFPGYSVVDNAYFAGHAKAVAEDPSVAAHLPGLADPSPFFLASARFMERKNLPLLVRAYGRYRHAATEAGEQPWRLILLGDGPLRPSLEALIQANGISGLEMPGWRQIEDLPLYYGRAGALVHTAIVDQWGLVVNEAMAAGLPVIASSGTGAARDLVREGINGFVFHPDDESTLVGLLVRMAHEVNLRDYSAASQAIIAEWPLELFGQGLQRAVEAGRETSQRSPSPLAAGLIKVMSVVARSPHTFHAVEV